MVETSKKLDFSSKSFLLLLILTSAGFAGNFFAPTIFIGFSYLFGSIAVLLVVYLYGIRWGLVAGLAASSWTIALFGHPYAMVWLCAEPLFVGWLLAKGKTRNIILCDAVYWPCIGVPLIWIFFQYVMHVSTLGTVSALLMYWAIGVSNALIASLLLTYFPRLATIRAPAPVSSIPIHELIFGLMMAVVMLPAMTIMVIHGKDMEHRLIDNMYDRLADSSRAALSEVKLKLQKQLAILNELARFPEKLDLNAPSGKIGQLQMTIELLQKSNIDFHDIYVANAAGRSIARYPDRDAQGLSLLNIDYSDRDYFKALQATHKPVISDLIMTRSATVTPGVAIAVPFVSKGALQGFAAAGVRPELLKSILHASRSKPFHQMTLVDGADRIIASTGEAAPMATFNMCDKGAMTKADSGNNIYRCMPSAASPLPLWQQAGNSTYLIKTPVTGASWQIVTETSFAPYQQILFKEHIRALLVVLSLNMITLAASLFTARSLAAPLRRLSQVTTDLPERLLLEEISVWPSSRITEIGLLSDNFRVMASALSNKFQEITYARNTLEIRVNERTEELTRTNEALKKEIIERKLAELHRDRLMTELEQKNKELEGIIYIASHDLRSPLVNIQGFSRKLLKNCSELDKLITGKDMDLTQRDLLESILREHIPKSLGFITGSVEKMDMLLNGLLRLSRLGRAALKFDTLDMRIILEKIIASMAFQIDAAGARIELGELGACVADAGQVTQVFSNLLDNALKYRSPDRPLIVRIFSEDVPCGIRYCVEDNGIGIAREHQEMIWEIFHRLNPDDSQGEGLGLTMARRIVDRLGGAIQIESEAGSGSRFYVLLSKATKIVQEFN